MPIWRHLWCDECKWQKYINAAFETICLKLFTGKFSWKQLRKIKEIIDKYGSGNGLSYLWALVAGSRWHEYLRARTHGNYCWDKSGQKEIICIADEVLTGFGRTGTLFAGEKILYKADIICLSKGLTGGTMVCGCHSLAQRKFMKLISRMTGSQNIFPRAFIYGESYCMFGRNLLSALICWLIELGARTRSADRTKHLGFRNRILDLVYPRD